MLVATHKDMAKTIEYVFNNFQFLLCPALAARLFEQRYSEAHVLKLVPMCLSCREEKKQETRPNWTNADVGSAAAEWLRFKFGGLKKRPATRVVDLVEELITIPSLSCDYLFRTLTACLLRCNESDVFNLLSKPRVPAVQNCIDEVARKLCNQCKTNACFACKDAH